MSSLFHVGTRHARRPHIAPVTTHAQTRMQGRGIPNDAIDAVLTYGRRVHTRGAEVYAIGRKEVARFKDEGIQLSDYEGVQVVVSRDGAVITVYRNRNFRWLKSGMGRGRYHRTAVAD